MASTFFGLNIAGSGLRAANAALNTTANNISNADTKGYSRQQVVQEAANALRIFETYGCAGAGVKTIAIERIRDEFYDVKYRENETRFGEYSTKNYYMKMVQDYFTDDGKTGFSTVFTLFKTAIQFVLENADAATAKQDFLGEAVKLTEYFNNSAENLEKLQKDINDEIKTKVEEINSLSQEIVILNKQINVIELSSGAQANELRDKRDNLVDQLSKVVDVETQEFPIYDSNDPDRETGAHRYIVRIAGGQKLVDNGDRNVLVCEARDSKNKVNQSDIVGLYDIYWEDTGDLFNTTNSRMGGELSALLKLRDGNNNESFEGTIQPGSLTEKKVKKPNAAGIDEEVTIQTVTVDVTADYLKDLNKCNLAESGTINIGNTLYRYDGWTFNTEIKNGKRVYSYTIELENKDDGSGLPFKELPIKKDVDNKVASVGSAIDYQGIPYYMEQMNEWVRLFARSVNTLMETGYTDDMKPGCLLFVSDYPDGESKFMELTVKVRDNAGAEKEVHVDSSSLDSARDKFGYDYWYDLYQNRINIFSGGDLEDGTYRINVRDDNYHRMTAGNFTVSDAVKANAELLATKKEEHETDGHDQYDNFTELLSTLTDSKKLSFRGADAGEFLTCVLGDITLAAGSADTFEENYTVLRNSLQNQRLSISGVDSDEEALSLVHYQDTLTLASKMISTFAEIYDQLILNTGV